MFIKKISLLNYKRFKDLTINLGDKPKRIIALIGPNGCGKSSVFDAMVFYQSLRKRIGNPRINKDLTYHYTTDNISRENIKIEFTDEDFSNKYAALEIEEEETSKIFSFRSSYRYNENLSIKNIKTVEPIETNSIGASTTTDLDDRIEYNYRNLWALYYKIIEEGDKTGNQVKEIILNDLKTSIQNCINLELINLGNLFDEKGTFIFTKPDYEGRFFEYNVLSSGEKEVVDILLDLYLRKNNFNDTIYIIDEPELHINSLVQRKLLIEINKIIPENCQIWIATHSIGFMRALQEDLKNECQIIEFEDGKSWASEKFFLEPKILSRSFWMRIFSSSS